MCIIIWVEFILIGVNHFNQFFKREESKEVKSEPTLQIIDCDLAVVWHWSLSDWVVILTDKVDNHVNAKEYVQALVQYLLSGSQILPKGYLIWHISDGIQNSAHHQHIPKQMRVGILT